jgi:hypothetical protein
MHVIFNSFSWHCYLFSFGLVLLLSEPSFFSVAAALLRLARPPVPPTPDRVDSLWPVEHSGLSVHHSSTSIFVVSMFSSYPQPECIYG